MTKVKARPDITVDPPIVIHEDRCDLCGACIGICPADCIAMNDHSLNLIGPECIRCGFCLPACPVEALYWNENGDNGFRSRHPEASGSILAGMNKDISHGS